MPSKETCVDLVSHLVEAAHSIRQVRSSTAAHNKAATALIGIIDREPDGLRASDLACALHMSPSTISRHVDEMVQAGFVERVASPNDGRATLLKVTAGGREHVKKTRAEVGEALRNKLSSWSDEDVRIFCVMLENFTHSLLREDSQETKRNSTKKEDA